MVFRYHPLDNRNFSIRVNIGYVVATFEDDLKRKFLTDIAVGYKVWNLGKNKRSPSIGYNYINYSIENVKKLNQSRLSIFLKIGLIY